MHNLTNEQRVAKNSARNFFKIPVYAQSAIIGGQNNTFSFEENVIGIGIGRKLIGNSTDSQEAVRIYVRVKIPQIFLSQEEIFPPTFGNLPTDVVEIGDVTAFATLTGDKQLRNRPTSCGVSVGHPLITAGTLGCLVEKDDKTYILSNNHVLVKSNSITEIGDKIIQQGTADGGFSPGENIATLSELKVIDFTGAANDIDAAIAELDAITLVEKEIIDIGSPLKTTTSAALYQSVRKHGRTTGHTIGVIDDISVDIWVNYGGKRAWFENQLGIIGVSGLPFSAGGDSGSLIVDAVKLNPVGLLFAGGTGITFANRIDDVLNHFTVSIVGT